MTSEQDRAWELMSKIDFCMLVTSPSDGLRSRPMSSIVKQEEGHVYFLTDARTAKDDEIAINNNILLAYGNGGSQFVSTSATARLSDDRMLIKRLWNPGAQAFWPSGPEDPNIVAIVATPTSAEFWDGPSGVVSSIKIAFALITGTTPDLGANSKVKL